MERPDNRRPAAHPASAPGSPPSLSAEQWRHAWALYEAVSEADPASRDRLLKAEDPAVAAEVLGMLARDDSPASPSQTGERTGERVGRFTIIRIIGKGGMAEVYLARDTELNRAAALKFVATENLEGRSLERAIREARAASAVNHPNIVTIYEVIRATSGLVIAMELVDGVPLRKHCGSAQSIGQLSAWGQQIASALAAAHAEGIVHLDLKPENIMIRSDQLLKVLDFGLARFVEQDSSASGRHAGTMRYMAPEQYRGEDVTPATDIFALGLILYELATGAHPFAAATVFETAHAIATRNPPAPSTTNTAIPPALDQLVLSMLEKDPKARPSAAQVIQALSKLPDVAKKAEPVPLVGTWELSKLRRFSAKWVLAGLAASIAVAAGIRWSTPRSEPVSVIAAAGPDDAIPPRHVYGILPKGNMAIYLDDSTDTSGYRWPVEGVLLPPIEGVNWAAFKTVFPGGDGILYAVTTNGLLKYFRLLDPWRNSGPLRWSADSNTVIGIGWSGIRDAAALSRPVWASPSGAAITGETSLVRDGVLWAFHESKKTFLFQHGWAGGGRPMPSEIEPANSNADYSAHYGAPSLPPNHTCSGCRVLEGGDGLTFAISKDGVLWRYRVRAGGNWAKPKGKAIRDQVGVEIGHDWTKLSAAFAAPGAYFIEGYVSTERREGGRTVATMSLSAGETVDVRASTFSPSYTVRLLRLERRKEGTSGLVDGLLVGSPVTREAPPGGNFKKPRDSAMSAKGAAWASDGAGLRLPANAAPGLYAAELTTPSGGRALAPFVVKPKPGSRPRNIAVIANALTWNGFNQWGNLGQPSHETSFERPLAESPVLGGVSRSPGLTDRNPRAFNQLVRAEVWVTSWLDRLAGHEARYAYDAFTDIDLDAGIPRLRDYKALIIHTLPHFWTDRMRDHLEEYLKTGGHLIYLAGKGMFQRAQLTSEGKMRIAAAGARRCKVPAEGRPPFPSNPCPEMDLFRWSNPVYPDGRSERSLTGLAHEPSLPQSELPRRGNYFVIRTAHPFLMNGTGLQAGSDVGKVEGLAGLMAADWGQGWRLPGGVYDEFPDMMGTVSHASVVGIDLADAIRDPRASIVFRDTGARGWVFSIGAASVGGVLAVDPVLQRIVTNALDAAIAGSKP